MAEDNTNDDPLSDAPASSSQTTGHGYDLINNVADEPTIYADGCPYT